MSTKATTKRDTNIGFHPTAPNDVPATRTMFAVIALLFIVGLVIAVLTYRHYNGPGDRQLVPEQQAPPLAP